MAQKSARAEERSRFIARKARDGEPFLLAALVRMTANEKWLVASAELVATKEPARHRRYKDTATTERRWTEAQRLRSRPHNYALPQRPLPFFQAGIPSFSRTVHSTLPDERKHIQVVQNKQLVSCSLDTIRKRSRAGFFTRIRRPGGFRGFTECPRELVAPLARDDNERRRTKTAAMEGDGKDGNGTEYARAGRLRFDLGWRFSYNRATPSPSSNSETRQGATCIKRSRTGFAKRCATTSTSGTRRTCPSSPSALRSWPWARWPRRSASSWPSA